MTQDLTEQLKAAYGEDRFTMTVTEIESRAGLRRRRTWQLAIGVAAAVAVVVAAGTVLFEPPSAHHGPVTATASPSAPFDWAGFTSDCLTSWDTAKLGPVPDQIVKRDKGGRGLLIYADDRSILTCVGVAGSRSGSLSNVDHLPRGGPAMDPDYRTVFSGESITMVSGWAPRGATGIEYLAASGKAYRSEIVGDVFFLWEPGGIPSPVESGTLRVIYPGQVVLGGSAPRKGSNLPPDYHQAEVNQWCQDAMGRLPVPGTKSSGPAEIFSRDLGGGHAIHLFADTDVLVKCGVHLSANGTGDVSLAYRPEGAGEAPFEQLFGQIKGGGFVIGRAPVGAVSGQVTLRGGRTVDLSVEDGVYYATWLGETPFTGPVRIQLETAAERWVYEDGKTSRTAR